MKIRQFLKKRYFIRSFKEIELKRFMKITLYDLLFIISLLAIIALFTNTLKFNMGSLAKYDAVASQIEKFVTDPTDILDITSEQLGNDFDTLPKDLNLFLFKTLSILIISLLLFAVASGLIKGKGYSLLLKKKFTKKFGVRFGVNSLLWLIFWMIIIGITTFGVKLEYSTYPILIELFLFIVTSPLFFVFSSEKSNFFIMLHSYFKLLILKIHRIIIPLVAMTLSFLLIISLLLLIGVYISKTVYFISLVIFMFLFFVWIRNYLYLIVKDISDKI